MIFQQNASDVFHDFIRARLIALLISIVGGGAIIVTAYVISKRMVKIIAKTDDENRMMNQQVIETGKLASIGELAAGIAHEINNPVAIMVEEAGWIEDLLEEEEFKESKNLEELKRALTQINTQGKRCKGITHKLLSFARKTDSKIHNVEINTLIKEIVSISIQMAKYSNINIETELQEGLPYVEISPAEMQQVLLNLFNNAIYAMEKTGGTIKIGTKLSQLEKDNIVIIVEDNGPGIPESNLPRIFDPFFTTKPVGKGTGLGLSICYGIVQKMGGKIDVQSAVDVGTRFRIWIPFQKEGVQEPEDIKNV
jgi:two-component system NtrC family sensor kinase